MYPWSQKLDWLIVFDSTHNALAAEAALENAGVEVLTVPVPRGLSAGCALGIAFRGTDVDKVKPVLADARVRLAGVYRRAVGAGKGDGAGGGGDGSHRGSRNGDGGGRGSSGYVKVEGQA